MRILQLTHRFGYECIGGVETHVYELSRHLVAKNHLVKVYTSDVIRFGSPVVCYPKSFYNQVVSGTRVHRFKSIQIAKAPYGLGFIFPGVIRQLVNEDVDALHAHSFGYWVTHVSALAHELKNVPLIITPHADPSKPAKPFDIRLLPLKTADHLIALTKSEYRYLANMGFDPDEISIIPEGVDLKVFKDSAEGDFKEKYGITGKVVLYVGRLAEEKGLSYLVYAIPAVLSVLPDVKIVFVGPDFGIKPYLKRLGESLGHRVYSSIIFVGELRGNPLLDAYSACDVLVLPSLIEAFGIVILEAMAMGKPVIATRVGGIPDIVKNGETGILVPPADSLKLSQSIITLLSNPELAKRMGQRGRDVVRRYHSWEDVADKTLDVYRKVL